MQIVRPAGFDVLTSLHFPQSKFLRIVFFSILNFYQNPTSLNISKHYKMFNHPKYAKKLKSTTAVNAGSQTLAGQCAHTLSQELVHNLPKQCSKGWATTVLRIYIYCKLSIFCPPLAKKICLIRGTCSFKLELPFNVQSTSSSFPGAQWFLFLMFGWYISKDNAKRCVYIYISALL